MKVGDRFTSSRTFTDEDIADFLRVSGDSGRQHRDKDLTGRLMVHGLHTATLPTKIGGELSYIAREMTFEFMRPVWSGDTVECRAQVTEVEPSERSTRVSIAFVCLNQDGKEVMKGRSNGVIL